MKKTLNVNNDIRTIEYEIVPRFNGFCVEFVEVPVFPKGHFIDETIFVGENGEAVIETYGFTVEEVMERISTYFDIEGKEEEFRKSIIEAQSKH